MLIAVGTAIIRIYITEKQASALAGLSILLSGAAAIGPFAGGALIEWWDWPAIFIVNIPFVAASFLLAWKMIPKDGPSASVASRLSLRGWLGAMDIAGILLFAAGLVALLVGVLSAKASGHLSAWNMTVGLLGLAAIGIFARHELRSPSPFIPLRTFGDHPEMTRVNVQYLLVNLLYYALFFGVPSYLQMVRHLSEFHTGILMLALGLSSIAASPIAGKWVDRSGPKPALIVSAVLMTAGSVWIVTWNPSSPIVSIGLALVAFGFSNGLNTVGMQAALFASSPREMAGVASGLFNTSRYFGTIMSSLLTGIIMGGEFDFAGFRILGIVLAAIALLLLAMNLRYSKQPEAISESR